MSSPLKSKSSQAHVLTINGGSSSIKFALFDAGQQLRRGLEGRIEKIGLPEAIFRVKAQKEADSFSRKIDAPDHAAAVEALMDWVANNIEAGDLAAVGHRLVHGGPKYWEPQRVTPEMLNTLHELSPFDPEHLPEEILLMEAFYRRFPDLPQIACFDTAFHHDLPVEARLLPIPRRYAAKGVRRYGFHGLSCTYLMEELEHLAGPEAARGRVIIAHLGNGASATAVRNGKSIDTSMSFTPTAGFPMSSRSGDLDPSLAWYFARTEAMTPEQFHHMVNHESGLLGISEISSDMSVLMARERDDTRAAEAVSIFCYQVRKWICSLAGALEGLDTLIFSGGIGENAADIRARICRGLGFLGVRLDAAKNSASGQIITQDGSPVTARVIRTDEEQVIAKATCNVLGVRPTKE